MKHLSYRIFCLLMVLAMVVCMIPSAFATETATEPSEAGANSRASGGTVDTTGMVYRANEKSDATIYFRGQAKSVNAMYTHNIEVNGTTYVAYCLNPVVDVPDDGSSYTGTSGSGEGGWGDLLNMTRAEQRAVGLALLYGAPNKLNYGGDRMLKRCQEAATGIIIWEFLCGMRSLYAPFNCTDSSLIDSFRGTCQVTDMAWTLGYDDSSTNYLINAYNSISADLAAHDIIPSFAGTSRLSAPTHTMNAVGNGSYTLTLTDTNNILSTCTFTNSNGMTYAVNGNKLTITASNASAIPNGTISQTKPVPNLDSQSFLIWERPGAQPLITFDEAKNDPRPFYFQLRIAAGGLTISKTTSDGGNLSGWQFGVYNDQACTQLLSGPHTTGADGTVTVSGLPTGTVWVKELGNTNSTIAAMYTVQANPKQASITDGGNTGVSFLNNIKLGSITLQKRTNTGNDLGNWKVDLYNSAKQFISTHTIPDSGILVIPNLMPGTYYLYEQASGDPLWICDTAEKTATVPPDGNVTVTFTNTHHGNLSVKKATNTGAGVELGWIFDCWKVDKADPNNQAKWTYIGQKTTNLSASDPTCIFEKLELGMYVIQENAASARDGYEIDTEYHFIEVTAGATATVTVTNEQLGSLQLTKTTNTGSDLGNWKVDLLDGNKTLLGTYTFPDSGELTIPNLHAGTYYLKEHDAEDPLWECDVEEKTVTIIPGQTASVSFRNVHHGNLTVQKASNTGAGVELGWTFDCWFIEDPADQQNPENWTFIGQGTTKQDVQDPTYTFEKLLPGLYAIQENASSAKDGYALDTSYHYIQVPAGETVTVTVTNEQLGSIKLVKHTNTGNDLGGWEVDLLDAGRALIDTYTLPESGELTISNLHAGTYYLKEHDAEDPLWKCDLAEKEAIVIPGQTAEVTFTNTHHGNLTVKKATNTGAGVELGWIFDCWFVEDPEDKEVPENWTYIGQLTTKEDTEDPSCTFEKLLPGLYVIQENEISAKDGYEIDTAYHYIDVVAGETVTVTVTNEQLGSIHITKTTNTGKDLGGWEVDLLDSEKVLLGTYTIPESGELTISNLHEGTYFLKEHDAEDPLWECDTEEQEIQVEAGKTSEASFENTHYGCGLLKKTLTTEGPLMGWTFRVTQLSDGTEIGKFTTNERGEIQLKLLPGKYEIEEILPEGSLFYSVSGAKQTIEIEGGKTTEMEFVNALQAVQLQIVKITPSGSYLQDAEFLLEWKDGDTWKPVAINTEPYVVRGGCSSAELKNGCLTTNGDGIASFDGLFPGLEYRLRETKAPADYILPDKEAFEGKILVDTILRVKNNKIVVNPNTGEAAQPYLFLGMIAVCAGAMFGLYILDSRFRKGSKK